MIIAQIGYKMLLEHSPVEALGARNKLASLRDMADTAGEDACGTLTMPDRRG